MEATWIQTPDFEKATNFKEFFLRDDALSNLNSEIIFSIFKRYLCKAGCKMCYVRDMWIQDDAFGRYIPKEITPVEEAKILNLWNNFEICSTIDDLFWIKKDYPHLYDFYKKHSHRLHSSSMTDVAFIQQFDLNMTEMNYKGIYEITFSDKFLQKKGGRFADDIVDMLKEIHAKMPVFKIKFILCDKANHHDPSLLKVIKWCDENGVGTDLHDDITQGENNRYEDKATDHQETNHYSEGSYPYLIMCETVYQQFDEVFLILTDALTAEIPPFYTMETEKLDHTKFILSMLHAKVKKYGDHISKITRNHASAKYLDYFSYINSSVIVHDDFTFIPKFILKPYTKLYKMMTVEMGGDYIDTPHGLFRQGATSVIPLVTITDKPKVKLYHIPIKCAPVEAAV